MLPSVPQESSLCLPIGIFFVLVYTIILGKPHLAIKMTRFNAMLILAFVFALMCSASMAKSHSWAKAPSLAEAHIAATPKLAATESPATSPPSSAPSEDAKRSSSASAPSSSHTPQSPASRPLAAGPGTASPPKSAAAATATLENIMAIFGAALLGGATFLL